jgi:hypothetical protein
LVVAAVAVAATGCSGGRSLNLSKAVDLFTISAPESSVLPAEDASLGRTGPVGPDEFVDAAGQCSGGATVDGAPAPTSISPVASPVVSNPPADAQPTVFLGGVALGMTECEVVRRAGPPGNVVISADENGDRLAVVSYLTGNWPGIYRFSSGRLKEIERAPEPPAPAKPVRKKRSSKQKPKSSAR